MLKRLILFAALLMGFSGAIHGQVTSGDYTGEKIQVYGLGGQEQRKGSQEGN